MGSFSNTAIATTTTSLTPHAPIYIDGNSDFATQASNEGWAGDGTAGNPYIIENYEINASTADGIEIRNTDVYFVIRNCVIREGKDIYDGIYFYKVTNGKIDNVTSSKNSEGICVENSSNNEIANCNVSNNLDGIDMENSSSNKITRCYVSNNSLCGINLRNSSNNKIKNCNVYNGNGIHL